MGATGSRFDDQSSLIDSLLTAVDVSPDVERVFRLVDRGFFATEPKVTIYCDMAWKVDKLHLSAPSIYLNALRSLDIHPGHAVLNIGSGTGYLSTIFGLLVGSNGMNHGIEVHETNVRHARERVFEFVRTSDAIYERDFCPPYFMVGNIFNLVPLTGCEDSSANDVEEVLKSPITDILPPPQIKPEASNELWPTYDRIYCGAMISTVAQLKAILRLLKVGGRIVTPLADVLYVIDRVTADTFDCKTLSSVSFLTLQNPSDDASPISPPRLQRVDSLQRLSARAHRRHLRRIVMEQHGGALPTLGHLQTTWRCLRKSSLPPPPTPLEGQHQASPYPSFASSSSHSPFPVSFPSPSTSSAESPPSASSSREASDSRSHPLAMEDDDDLEVHGDVGIWSFLRDQGFIRRLRNLDDSSDSEEDSEGDGESHEDGDASPTPPVLLPRQQSKPPSGNRRAHHNGHNAESGDRAVDDSEEFETKVWVEQSYQFRSEMKKLMEEAYGENDTWFPLRLADWVF